MKSDPASADTHRQGWDTLANTYCVFDLIQASDVFQTARVGNKVLDQGTVRKGKSIRMHKPHMMHTIGISTATMAALTRQVLIMLVPSGPIWSHLVPAYCNKQRTWRKVLESTCDTSFFCHHLGHSNHGDILFTKCWAGSISYGVLFSSILGRYIRDQKCNCSPFKLDFAKVHVGSGSLGFPKQHTM